jgi:amidase
VKQASGVGRETTGLATLGPSAPVKTLTELREWNITHITAGSIRFGQSQLDISDEMDVQGDRARYEQDRAKDIELAGTHGIEDAMKRNNLDALLFPGASGAAIAAKPGYPTVIVPFTMVPNAPVPGFPAGFDATFAIWSEFHRDGMQRARLIELAYAFEQAAGRQGRKRVTPPSVP